MNYKYQKKLVYKAISYKFSEKKSENLKMCCINIQLTSNPNVFHTI